MTIAQEMYIRAGIIATVIIYRIQPDITAHMPFEGMMTFSVANWITIQITRQEER